MTWNPKAFAIMAAAFAYIGLAVFIGKIGVVVMIIVPFYLGILVFIYAAICSLLEE